MRESSMNALETYGKLLHSYAGEGVLHIGGAPASDCRFEVVQLADGRLYADCWLSESIQDPFDTGQELELQGTTDLDQTILLEGLAVFNYSFDMTKGESGQRIRALGRELAVVNDGSLDQGSITLKFALTNLEFLGTQFFSVEQGGETKRKQLPLQLNEIGVILRPTPDHLDTLKELSTVRGVDVTAEALVGTSAIGEEAAVTSVIDDLCTLLTLARGCRVEWLYYEVISTEGELLRRQHRNSIAKPFGTLDLLARLPPQDLPTFIQEAFPVLQERGQIWQLRKAIDAYTDAKVEGDFLESRGLKMVVVMELLRGRFLSHVRQPPELYVLEPALFKSARRRLVDECRRLLERIFPEADSGDLEIMACHAQAFNWYPFRRSMTELCRQLGLGISSGERHKFVEIRNALVHRLEFHQDQAKYGANWEQFTFLMTFVGKVLLAVLRYQGYFYDWTKPPGWEGASEMRVRLALKELGK
jgi:hypothetical protein